MAANLIGSALGWRAEESKFAQRKDSEKWCMKSQVNPLPEKWWCHKASCPWHGGLQGENEGIASSKMSFVVHTPVKEQRMCWEAALTCMSFQEASGLFLAVPTHTLYSPRGKVYCLMAQMVDTRYWMGWKSTIYFSFPPFHLPSLEEFVGIKKHPQRSVRSRAGQHCGCKPKRKAG